MNNDSQVIYICVLFIEQKQNKYLFFPHLVDEKEKMCNGIWQ